MRERTEFIMVTTRNEKGQFVKGCVKDITGEEFGLLKVIKLDHIKDKRSYWLCQCQCGKQKVIRGDCLKVIQSCGCVKKKQDTINLHIINNHKHTYHPVYRVWQAMMARCYNPNQKSYKNYGGRGIKVCEEWHDVITFCKWADESGFIPNQDLSIERVNVNGNYDPSNCEWIPKIEQSYNKTNTVKFLDYDGEMKSVSKVAKLKGITTNLALCRYEKGIVEPKYLFHKGNLQKDFPEIFGGYLKGKRNG